MSQGVEQPKLKNLEVKAPAQTGATKFGRPSCQSCLWRMALANTCNSPTSPYFGKHITPEIFCKNHFPGKRLNSMNLIKGS